MRTRHEVAGLVLLACLLPPGLQAQVAEPAGDPPGAEPADSVAPGVGRRTSWVVLPAVFYTPETRIGGGGALFLTHRRDAVGRPTTGHLSALYTQEKQSMFGFGVDSYTRNDTYRLSGYAGYQEFPTTFHGVGNHTPGGLAEDYTPRTLDLRASVARRVTGSLRVGASYELARSSMVEVEPGRLLEGDLVPGAAGGTVTGPGLVLIRDDRDNVFAPTRGSYHTLSSRFFGRAFGGDHSFTSHTLDLRRYRQLRPGHVLAVQGLLRATTGDPPFQMMPSLGGQNLLRGYFDGRYIDRHALAAQAEYRAHVAWRFGAVAFLGAGQVADRFNRFRADGVHLSGGGGLRFLLDPRERMSLRIDYGAGAGGTSGLYITVTEAF